MPLHCELQMNIEQTGETITISGDFSDQDVKTLEAFVEYAKAVWDTDFIQVGEKGRMSINWTEEAGMTVSTVLPEWDQVIVFLHKFRPILLNNESTYFYKVHNIIAKTLQHEYIRNSLSIQHELYSGKHAQSRYQIRSNDVLLNSEKVLFDWLNSHEFHREEDKKAFIESLHQLIPLDAGKVIFLGLLVDKAIASRNIAKLIQVILGKEKELSDIPMKAPKTT